MYPGNVLILDTVIAPCQDMPIVRVVSPRAIPACPGTFPRYSSSRPHRRHPDPLRHPDRSGGTSRHPKAQLVAGNPFTTNEPTRIPQDERPATRASTGTRPGQAAPRSPLSPEGEGLGVRRSVSPNDQLELDNHRTPPGVLAHGFNLGVSGSDASPPRFSPVLQRGAPVAIASGPYGCSISTGSPNP